MNSKVCGRSFTHMIKQVLNNDFMSRSSSLHQGCETRPWLPVDERKSNEKLNMWIWKYCCTCVRINKDTHFTLASALLSSRNFTICWWPVLVQWNRAVQPRESFSSSSAPCFWGKNKKAFHTLKQLSVKDLDFFWTLKFERQRFSADTKYSCFDQLGS